MTYTVARSRRSGDESVGPLSSNTLACLVVIGRFDAAQPASKIWLVEVGRQASTFGKEYISEEQAPLSKGVIYVRHRERDSSGL